MNLGQIKSEKLILLETIAGSHLYGLNHADSDIDIRGVYHSPVRDFFGLNYTEQVSDDTNDTVFYELKRFVQLAIRNNPNILEILASDGDSIITRSPLMDMLPTDMFLSKLCEETFCGYAMNQIKKSHGLNKKMMNPQPEKRKDILSFCYIIDKYKSTPFWHYMGHKYGNRDKEFLFGEHISKFGLTKVENGQSLYAIFLNEGNEPFRGIVHDLSATDFRMSSIPKETAETETPLLMYFNLNGFKVHCKEHRDYWDWVEKRNESRHLKNKEIAKSYDSKNMMHTFRLLNVGEEIATEKKIFNDRRTIDTDFLFDIRNGKYEFAELLEMAETKMTNIKTAYSKSKLPNSPHIKNIENAYFNITSKIYRL